MSVLCEEDQKSRSIAVVNEVLELVKPSASGLSGESQRRGDASLGTL